MLSPTVYLTASYYERWFLRDVRLLTEQGLIDADEVEGGRALRPGKNLNRRFTLADVDKVTRRGSYGRPATAPARAPTPSSSLPRSSRSPCFRS